MCGKQYKKAMIEYKKKFRIVSEDNSNGGDKYKIQHSFLTRKGEIWKDGEELAGAYGCYALQTEYFDTKQKAINKINNIKYSLNYERKIENI